MASVQDRRSDGRGWVVHYRDPQGKSRSRSFTKRKLADDFAASVHTSVVTGTYIGPKGSRVPFGERYERWLASTVDVRDSTRARDESYAKSLVLPTFRTTRLGDIDHDTVQEWVAGLSAKGYAPATVHKAHQLLGKVLASAVSAKLIASNVCADTRLPKIEREEQMFLTPAQVATLAQAMDERYRSFVLTATYSGLRAGELFGLRRGRVDTLRATIDVAEIAVEVRGKLTFGPPKTRAGRRTVPIPRFVAEVLKDELAGLEPGALVFPSPNGSTMRASLFRRRFWYPATVKAGFGTMTKEEGKRPHYEGLRIHDLRHTAVAFWIAAGASPKEIAVRAGHSSIVTVLDRYGHLLPRDEDKVTDALDAMAREAAEKSADVVPLRAVGDA